MYDSLYDFERRNETRFDTIREFCLLERLNEESIRSSIKRHRKSRVQAAEKIKSWNLFRGLKETFGAKSSAVVSKKLLKERTGRR